MSMRYQFVIQSKDGEENFGETNNLKSKAIKKAERLLKHAIATGRKMVCYIKVWNDEDNEVEELYDVETIKYY